MPVSTQYHPAHTSPPLIHDSPMHARKTAPNPSGGRPFGPSSSAITLVNGSSVLRDSSNEPLGRRSSEAMSGGESTVGGDRPETKKKKKKGWKGWALVVEDEDGNLIDVKEDKALPANAVELTGEKSREGSLAMASDPIPIKRTQQSSSPHVLERESCLTLPAMPVPENPQTRLHEKQELLHMASDSRADPPLLFHLHPIKADRIPFLPAFHLPPPIQTMLLNPCLLQFDVHASSTMTRPSKRVTRSARRFGSHSPPSPPHRRSSTSPTAAPITDSGGAGIRKAGPSKENDQPAPKRRRKISPSSATPQPTHTPEPATAPRPATSKQGKPRPSASTTAPTRTTTAVLREEAKQSRLASPILPDEPTIPPVPRVGMGEVFPHPPESDIRGEARYIIESAARHREQERHRKLQRGVRHEEVNGDLLIDISPMSEPAYHYPAHPAHTQLNGNHAPAVYPTPSTSGLGFSVPLDYATAGPSSYTAQPGPTPSTSTRPRSDPSLFQPAFYGASDVYSNGVQDVHMTLPVPLAPAPPLPEVISLDDPGQMGTLAHQQPSVVLAPSTLRPPARDGMEKLHQEGYGLTPELEADALGFVENVRMNLREILTHYFPQVSSRRDAFLERVGRCLADLGWQLTDSGDGAL